MAKIAIMGFGTVGSGVLEVCRRNAASIARRAGEPVEVKYILDVRDFSDSPDAALFVKDINVILNDPEVKVVVETIGGTRFAYPYVRQCLESGRSVCTSNKEMVATYGAELLALAREHKAAFLFEASVGGGTPIITPMHQCLAANRFSRIAGILNGTTNYILSRMDAEGADYTDVLADAQAKGYAEADPTQDLNGGDIRRKLVISANIAFGCVLDEREVAVMGIEALRAADIAAFRRMGRVCKLVAGARKLPDGVAAYIEPALFPPSAHEAAVPENFNLISLTGLHIGKQSFYGQGAGRYPTAYNVLQDCVDVRNGLHHFYTSALRPAHVDNRSIARPYYVRTEGIDKWLQSHIDKILDCGIITEPVTVTEIHQWAQERKQTGAECFFASLR